MVVSLEERVDERSNGGALRQDQQQGKNAKRDQDGRHPPALVAPEEGKQFAGDPEPMSSGLQETHISSPTSSHGRILCRGGGSRHPQAYSTRWNRCRFPRRAIPRRSRSGGVNVGVVILTHKMRSGQMENDREVRVVGPVCSPLLRGHKTTERVPMFVIMTQTASLRALSSAG